MKSALLWALLSFLTLSFTGGESYAFQSCSNLLKKNTNAPSKFAGFMFYWLKAHPNKFSLDDTLLFLESSVNGPVYSQELSLKIKDVARLNHPAKARVQLLIDSGILIRQQEQTSGKQSTRILMTDSERVFLNSLLNKYGLSESTLLSYTHFKYSSQNAAGSSLNEFLTLLNLIPLDGSTIEIKKISFFNLLSDTFGYSKTRSINALKNLIDLGLILEDQPLKHRHIGVFSLSEKGQEFFSLLNSFFED